MNPGQGRILGIDYGSKRVGLAISDPTRTIAQGVPTLLYSSNKDLIKKIGDMVTNYGVTGFVVGLPLNLKGQVGAAALKVQAFVALLETTFNLQTTVIDERFTSRIAERTLQSCGKAPSKTRDKIDKISAILILQGYLDRSHASV